MDVLGGGVAARGGEEGVTAGGWVRVLAAGWVIWSSKKYVVSPSMARRMPDLEAPDVVVLATRNS